MAPDVMGEKSVGDIIRYDMFSENQHLEYMKNESSLYTISNQKKSDLVCFNR